eukprot:589053-Pleurochrysis_carterae.AAC.1
MDTMGSTRSDVASQGLCPRAAMSCHRYAVRPRRIDRSTHAARAPRKVGRYQSHGKMIFFNLKDNLRKVPKVIDCLIYPNHCNNEAQPKSLTSKYHR